LSHYAGELRAEARRPSCRELPLPSPSSCSEKDELYVISELFDTDLHRIIQSPQPLGDAHFKHFLYQLLRGLRFSHAYGIVHRDLKPANLLVTKNCDLVISDFGLARQMPEGPMTEHVVTRWYRAPELMLSADGNYTQAVDVWSVGCVLAELLGRSPLFAGRDFMQTVEMQSECRWPAPKWTSVLLA
jgi:serine/threonine protein kinase